MRNWFKARIESLIDNIIFTAIVAGVAVVWTAVKSLPIPVITGVFVGVFVIVLISIRLLAWKMKRQVIQVRKPYEEQISSGGGECGLVFHNSKAENLTNCHARLIDLAFETPHSQYSLANYPKAEDLVCPQNIAAFGDGKILLFRWGWGMASKDLEIVYQSKARQIGYRIVNVPILVLLNLWADNTPMTYAICKLEDRLGWGYQLSVLKTGAQQDNLNLATFQPGSRQS